MLLIFRLHFPKIFRLDSHLCWGSSLHLHDEQRLVWVAFNHLLRLLQNPLLDVSLVVAVQVIHGLFQALQGFPHLILLPLRDYCGAYPLQRRRRCYHSAICNYFFFFFLFASECLSKPNIPFTSVMSAISFCMSLFGLVCCFTLSPRADRDWCRASAFLWAWRICDTAEWGVRQGQRSKRAKKHEEEEWEEKTTGGKDERLIV